MGRLNGTCQILEAGVRSRYLLGNGDAPWYGGAAVITSDLIKQDRATFKKYLAGMHRGFEEVRKNMNASRSAYSAFTTYDAKLADAIPVISYTLFDEFTPSDIKYFQDNYDMFYAAKILTNKLEVASMIYKA